MRECAPFWASLSAFGSTHLTVRDRHGVVRGGDDGPGGLLLLQAARADAAETILRIVLLQPTAKSAQIIHLIKDMGDLMYRLFTPDWMQRHLHDTTCSLILTTNDLELPWELLYCNREFLCLERPVARMPMGSAVPSPKTTPSPSPKLRFLLIYSDPDGTLPAAEAEIRQIQGKLQQSWKDRIDITVLRREESTGVRLNKELRAGTFDVIHYAGHANFDTQRPDLSGLLLLKKEIFFAQKIRRLLEGRPLVFLNACESGRTANEGQAQSVSYMQQIAEGLAAAFIYGGALACIGPLWPVYDKPAADFAVGFYNKVLEGHMIGEATRLARLESKQQSPDQITWAAFALYGNPTFRLAR